MAPHDNGSIGVEQDADPKAAEQAERAEYVCGLRDLADFLAEHPEIDFYLPGSRLVLNWYTPTVADLATAGRVLGRAEKESTERYLELVRSFGPHQLKAWAPHSNVCERVVVGTETVTKEVPDPEALKAVPTVTVTEEREVVEWRCPPSLLAGAES